MVRNLIRILDVFLFPFLAVISMIVTARAQRLGDLAAGTMVVREASSPRREPIRSRTAPTFRGRRDRAVGARVRRDPVVPRPAGIARPVGEVAARRTARVRLRGRVGSLPDGLGDEAMLEAVAQSYRQRFEGGSAPS